MEVRALGDSGLLVSRIGLGCNAFGARIDKSRSRLVVDAAVDAGVTFFDTARSYGYGVSEEFLGEILVGRRDQLVIATKFGGLREDAGGLCKGSGAYMRRALGKSLASLRTDYIDLYYIHAPDPQTPLVETLGSMQELLVEGTVRAIGCSNVDAEALRELEQVARASERPHFSALQNGYNLLNREADETTRPLCCEYNVGFVPYLPLAGGLLTGKYRRDQPPPPDTRFAGSDMPTSDVTWNMIDALTAFARDRGRTLLELAVGSVASQRGVASVITGATTPEQVRANVAAGQWQFDDADLIALAVVQA